MAHKNRWILVTADRGIPDSITFFTNRRDAVAEEKRFRKRMNLDYEDTELFQINLGELLAKKSLRIEV
jgi:hypothetical protein